MDAAAQKECDRPGLPQPLPHERRPALRQGLLTHVAGTRALLALYAGIALLSVAGGRPALFVLLGYMLWSALLLWLTLRGWRLAASRLWLWVDAAVLLLAGPLLVEQFSSLAALTVLPVVALALLKGLAPAVLLAATCAAGLWLVMAFGAGTPQVALAEPFVLLALGPAAALLSRPSAAQQLRRQLVEELNRQTDPRQGLQRQVEVLMALLAAHFGLDGATLDLQGPEPRVFRWQPGAGTRQLAGDELLCWRDQRRVLSNELGFLSSSAGEGRLVALDPARGAAHVGDHGTRHALLAAEGHALSLPLHSYGQPRGYIWLQRREPAFEAADLRGLHELMREVLPLLERTDLLEQLQRETSTRERERIGRDLHDSAVQPYLGLKFGLEALARMAGKDNPLAPQIGQLLQLTNTELQLLRTMVSGLRRGDQPGAADDPLAALQRQARRFEALYGLQVEIDAPSTSPLRGAVAKALLHMFNEGLTNVRRHTRATSVQVRVSFDDADGQLHMRLRNDRPAAQPAPQFVPRSLSERAADFGGAVTVSYPDATSTVVAITLPLPEIPA